MSAEPVRTTVPLAGTGWDVRPLHSLGCVAMGVMVYGEAFTKTFTPDDARALGAALIAGADLVERR